MPKIFISYRRADSQTIAGRIYDRLVAEYGKRNVFKDVDDIPPGRDFRTVIRSAVTWCDVMLVIVGPKWLDVRDSSGSRRIDNPRDYVRLELEAGLRSDRLLVMPVLVHHAEAPDPADLPETLRQFAFRNAVSIEEDPNFHRDMERLIDSLNQFSRPQSPRRKSLAIGSLLIAVLLTAALIAYSVLRPDDEDQHGGIGPTPTLTVTATDAPTITPTDLPTATATLTSTATPTDLPTATVTPTSTPQPTPLPEIAPPLVDDLEGPFVDWVMVDGWTLVPNDGVMHYDAYLLGQLDPTVDGLNTADLYFPYQINLADTQTPILYFWERYDLSRQGLTRVEVWSDQTDEWVALRDRAGQVNYAETRAAINLQAYAGQAIQLRFQLVAGESDPEPIAWWFDDLIVIDLDGMETVYTPPYVADAEDIPAGEWAFGEGCSARPSTQQQVGQMFACDLSAVPRPATTWVEFGGLIDLRQTKNPQLTWQQTLLLMPTDTIRVQIAVERGDWLDLYTQPPEIPQTWSEVTLSLARYAGQLIRLRFILDSPYPTEMTYWWFDNITVTDEH